MRTFKSFSLNLIALIAALTLAACDLSAPQGARPDAENEGELSIQGDGTSDKPNLGPSTFAVEFAPSKSSMLESRTTGAFQLPTAKVYNLVACLKDTAYNKTIQGHKFKIKELNQVSTTDSAGCLSWKENIQYNYLADSKYIRIDRHIMGTGLHKGTRRVSFAINPWSHGETLPSVLEVKPNSEIPQLVESAEAVQQALKGRPRPLWVEEGRLFMTEQRMTAKGVELNAEFRASPSIMLSKMNGEVYQRPLTSGSFKARMKLIHVYVHNNKEIRRSLGESAFEDIRMSNASLAIKQTIALPAIPTRGQIYLGLQLVPVDGPEGLNAFDGIYMLGEYDTIKGTSILKVSTLVAQTKNFQIANYLNAASPTVTQGEDHKDTTLDSDAYQKPKIEFGYIRYLGFTMGPENLSNRRMNIKLQACLKNGIDQKIIRSHTFKITKFRQKESDKSETVVDKTDNNSCINWNESITYNAFECRHFIKGAVRIENSDLGTDETHEIAINPWEPADLVRDLRTEQDPNALTYSCSEKETSVPTQMQIDSYTYSTQGYDYRVDDLLNLTVYKKVRFRLEPRLVNYSSTSNGRGDTPQKLRDGIYLLKTAVLRNVDYDPSKTLVSFNQNLVNVVGGLVAQEITFPIKDLAELGNRNNILIEVYPVNESKVVLVDGQLPKKLSLAEADALIERGDMLIQPFIGSITLNMDETGRNLSMFDQKAVSSYFVKGYAPKSPLQSVITQLVEQSKEIRKTAKTAQAAKASTAVYAKENNLDLINLSQVEDVQPMAKLFGQQDVVERLVLTKADLQEVINTGKVNNLTAQKFCNFWAKDYMAKMYADKGGALMSDMTMHLAMECYNASKRDPSRFFQTEKRLQIKKVAGSQHMRGLNYGVTVGTTFNLNTSHATYVGVSKSWATKVGLGYKFLDLFSLGSDYSYTLSWSQSDGNSAQNGISVNGSTTLAVQQNIVKLKVDSYEQCAVVRLNPRLFMASTKRNYIGILNPRLTEQETVAAATRGLYLCEGTVRNQPTELTENYYFLVQDQTSGQSQDVGDARNRTFLMALRSTNDFDRFMLAMKGQLKMPADATTKDNAQEMSAKMMMNLFDLPASSYPGMYLVQ